MGLPQKIKNDNKILIIQQIFVELVNIWYQENSGKNVIAENALKLKGSIYMCEKDIPLTELTFVHYQASTVSTLFMSFLLIVINSILFVNTFGFNK